MRNEILLPGNDEIQSRVKETVNILREKLLITFP